MSIEDVNRFVEGAPLADGTEDEVRRELRLAIGGASLGIESLATLHEALDTAVTDLDAGDWERDDYARGFAAGRAYGLQRAQVAVGLSASQLAGKAVG